MRRLINLFEYSLQGMQRRGGKNLALLLIFSAVVGFFASIVFFTSSLQREAQVVLRDIPDLWLQKLAGGRLQPIPLSVRDSLRDIRGIQQIIPRTWGYYYDSPTGTVYTIMGSDSTIRDTGLILFDPAVKLTPGQALVGNGFFNQHHLDSSSSLNLIGPDGNIRSFSMSAVFTTDTDLLTYDLIILSTSDAREILGLPAGQATDMALRIYNTAEVDNIAFKINRRFPDIRAVSRSQIERTYHHLFSWRGGIFIYGGLISLLAFLILVWDRAAGFSSDERHELGILKGLGWQINDILLIRFFEGLATSLTSTLLGITAALVHIYVLDGWLIKPFFTGWSVLFPPYNLPVNVQMQDVLLIASVSIIPYLAATIIPGWRSAIIPPAEVMHSD